MRSLMPKPFEPALFVQEQTPDGFAEVSLELNGHEIATTVVSGNGDVYVFYDWWRKQVIRRC